MQNQELKNYYNNLCQMQEPTLGNANFDTNIMFWGLFH